MNRKLIVLFIVAAVLVMLPTTFVAAQTALDPAANPNYAIIGLDPNFFDLMEGNPAVVGIVSGGDVDVSAGGAGPACRGFATSQPDMVFVWNGQIETLRVFFNSLGDTTLIINQPDGSYICNDDGDGLNPVIDLVNPAEGEYAVWVGSFSSTALNAGYLFLSTDTTLSPSSILNPLLTSSGTPNTVNPTTSSGSTGGLSGSSGSTGGLSGSSGSTGGLSGSSGSTGAAGTIALQPAGAIALSSGFLPDPYAAAISAGGPIDVSSLNIGAGCRGFAPDNPQIALTFGGQSPNLRVFFVADQIADSTMVVQLPNGSFVCNDDFPGGNLNPLVDIPNAGPGVYNIYVGTFGSGQSHPGVVYITELSAFDPITVGQ